MKYRHSYHAGNFADVHKHVTLLALIGALQKKDKGFLYLDTHAGRGSYDLSSPTAEARRRHRTLGAGGARGRGTARLRRSARRAARALQAAAPATAARRCWRCTRCGPQDRAVLIELAGRRGTSPRGGRGARSPPRAARRSRPCAWSAATASSASRPGCHRRNGAASPSSTRRTRSRGGIWPRERGARGRPAALSRPGCRRRGIPIKDERTTRAWQAGCARTLGAPALVSELWLFRRDSRVALNGSGLLIVNPPHLAARAHAGVAAGVACASARAAAQTRAAAPGCCQNRPGEHGASSSTGSLAIRSTTACRRSSMACSRARPAST